MVCLQFTYGDRKKTGDADKTSRDSVGGDVCGDSVGIGTKSVRMG